MSPQAEKTGSEYLETVHSIAHDLQSNIELLENFLEEDQISEEAAGNVRVTLGNTRLFIAEKLKQCEKLCLRNVHRLPDDDFPPTNTDLAGFFEICMLQVNQLNAEFSSIKAMKIDNWRVQDKQVPPRPVSRRRQPVQPAVTSRISNEKKGKRTELQRKIAEERRRCLLNQKKEDENDNNETNSVV